MCSFVSQVCNLVPNPPSFLLRALLRSAKTFIMEPKWKTIPASVSGRGVVLRQQRLASGSTLRHAVGAERQGMGS